MLNGDKRTCSLTIPRAAWSKYLWLTNTISTRDPAVIANLGSISGTCYNTGNCTTAYSFKYAMSLTEHPCAPGTSPRFAATSQGSILMSSYSTNLFPGKETFSGDVIPFAWFPLVGAEAARWSLSWGQSPTLSPVIALVNTTDVFSKICAQDSKQTELFKCDMNKLRPLTIGNRWCTKRACADQILQMPQANDYALAFTPYASFVWNFSNWREAYNPRQTPPVELVIHEKKAWG